MENNYPFVTISGEQIAAKRIKIVQRAIEVLLQKFPDIDLDDSVLLMTMVNKKGTINIEHILDIPRV